MSNSFAALQTPLSMGFSRQEYRSRLPFPSPEGLPNLVIEPTSPALAGGFFITELCGKPNTLLLFIIRKILERFEKIKLSVCSWAQGLVYERRRRPVLALRKLGDQ